MCVSICTLVSIYLALNFISFFEFYLFFIVRACAEYCHVYLLQTALNNFKLYTTAFLNLKNKKKDEFCVIDISTRL